MQDLAVQRGWMLMLIFKKRTKINFISLTHSIVNSRRQEGWQGTLSSVCYISYYKEDMLTYTPCHKGRRASMPLLAAHAHHASGSLFCVNPTPCLGVPDEYRLIPAETDLTQCFRKCLSPNIPDWGKSARDGAKRLPAMSSTEKCGESLDQWSRAGLSSSMTDSLPPSHIMC